MKLLHTADWHLGARLGRHDRMEDHRTALRALLHLAESERPDLIIHAGDLFDAYRPPYSALRLGVLALQGLAGIAPTVVIRGNHDSPELLGVLDQLAGVASPRRLWFVTDPQVLEFRTVAELPVAVACVPFVPPGAITDYATDDASRFEGKYADGIGGLNNQLIGEAREVAGPRGIVLYTAHLHVDGARPGRSERRFTVGEDHATHTTGLHRALYCAFGHIHDPQQLPGSALGRYAGSLIPLDYGESRQSKLAVVVTIGDDVRVSEQGLPPGRPLESFSGTLDELRQRAADGALDGCFLKAVVTSDDPIPDLADRVVEWSPRCVVFSLVNDVANRRVKPISQSGNGVGGEPAIDELFAEWRTTAATGKATKAPHEAVVELFREAMGQAEGEEGPDFGATALAIRAERVLSALTPGPATRQREREREERR